MQPRGRVQPQISPCLASGADWVGECSGWVSGNRERGQKRAIPSRLLQQLGSGCTYPPRMLFDEGEDVGIVGCARRGIGRIASRRPCNGPGRRCYWKLLFRPFPSLEYRMSFEVSFRIISADPRLDKPDPHAEKLPKNFRGRLIRRGITRPIWSFRTRTTTVMGKRCRAETRRVQRPLSTRGHEGRESWQLRPFPIRLGNSCRMGS